MTLSPKSIEESEPEFASDQYGYKKDLRTAFPQMLAVSVKNLLLLAYGMTLGFPTILIPAVKEPSEDEVLYLDSTEISWTSSINLIVVPLGCALSGIVTAPLGRRRAMQLVNIPFIITWLLFYFSSTTYHLYGALFLTGLAGGLLEAPVLTYVAEITQPHLRGALAATSSLCIILGVFTQFLFGIFLYWRTVALVNITFNVLAIVMLCFVPESPHWLISKNRLNDARKSLQWLRGWTQANAVDDELTDIQALFKKKKDNEELTEPLSEKLQHFLSKSFGVPLFLVSVSFFIGHFSGMTTLQTYAVSIFQMLQAPIDKYYATLLLGVVQILGSSLCVILVHYTGKRPLAFFSTGGAGLCCLLVAVYDGYIQNYDVSQATDYLNTTLINNGTKGNVQAFTDNPYSWIPMVLLLLLALITHTGIRLLPWILIGEVFSAKTRSGGAGLASAVGYIFGFLTNKTYISMVNSMNIYGSYGFYSIVSFAGCALLYFILPETEGQKLSDIENHFAGVKRLSNNVFRPKSKEYNDAKLKNMKGHVNPTFEDNSKL